MGLIIGLVPSLEKKELDTELALSTMGGYSKKKIQAKKRTLTRNPTGWHLILDTLVPRTVRNFCGWLNPVCGILLWQPEHTNINIYLGVVWLGHKVCMYSALI